MGTVQLTVERNSREGPVIHLAGECDMASVDALSAAGRDVIATVSPGGRVTVEMHSLAFLDCSGLGTLVAMRNAATDQDVELRLRAVPHHVNRILALTAMADSFVIES